MRIPNKHIWVTALLVFLVLTVTSSIYVKAEDGEENGDIWEQIRNAFSSFTNWFWEQLLAIWNYFVGGMLWLFNTIRAFFSEHLSKLWEFIQNISTLFLETMKGIADAITNTMDLIKDFLGKWGEPELYTQIQMSKVMYPEVLSNAYYVKDVAIPLGRTDLLQDSRTIEDITPSGVLGMISFFIYTVKGSYPLVQFILQNFVLLHLIAIICLLVWGFIGAIEKRDADYFIENMERVAGIFKFYVKIVTWFIERLIDFGTMVAQWLDTIIPF